MDLRIVLCTFLIISLASAQKINKTPERNNKQKEITDENKTQVEEVQTRKLAQVKSFEEFNRLNDDEENEDKSSGSDESNNEDDESGEESEQISDRLAKLEEIKPMKVKSGSKNSVKQNSNTGEDKNVTDNETKRIGEGNIFQLGNETKKYIVPSREDETLDKKEVIINQSDNITQSIKELAKEQTKTSQSFDDKLLKQEPVKGKNESETNKTKENKDAVKPNLTTSEDNNFINNETKRVQEETTFRLVNETKTEIQTKEDKAPNKKEAPKNAFDNITKSLKEQVEGQTNKSQTYQEPGTDKRMSETTVKENQQEQNKAIGIKEPGKKASDVDHKTLTPKINQKQKPVEKLAENRTISQQKPINTKELPENKEEKKKTQQNPKNNTNQGQKPKSKSSKHPHIVFIMVDDLGWNDVSFHGSDQIMTPNIDTLAYTGVVLPQYYTDVQGTASRSALFTGKLPLRLGTHGDSIKAFEDRGIPVSELLLPTFFRDQGYATHLIGKWDVGKSRQHYLPTSRGFDTFYGFLGSAVDYYTYNLIEEINQTSYFGLDFFDGTTPVENQQGYLTEVLTNRAVQIIRDHKPEIPLYLHFSHAAPHAGGGLVNLQVPESDIQANNHIAHSARRLYAGLVTNLDKSVGNVIAALAEREMLENTLIVFVSDNGAPTIGETQNYGSNLPLRGLKNTPWEGGARSVALLWHKSLKPRTYNGLFHVTDWLPTLLRAAGSNTTAKVDGLDQWDLIVEPEKPPKRMDVLVSINKDWAAMREGHFKLIVGNVDRDKSGYQGGQLLALRHKPLPYETILLQSETYMVFKETLKLVLDVDEAMSKRKESSFLSQRNKNNSEPCIPTKDKGCLYNITADPTEAKDLWNIHPDIVRRLTLRLRTFWAELKLRATKRDLRADPTQHKYIWVPWVKNDEVKIQPNLTSPPFPLHVSMGELQYLVDLNLNMFREKIYESVKSMGDSFLKSVGGLFSF